ncbi:UDP-N-acetylglucosamine 2-epimerase (non-hydrolysing) [Mariprofundus aestuarium]|uniref:UDP-N-acetylglucosamine 2-epimerase (Non-hydrolysing) n=1 Tax=Mariprofundus aestuarium TaxID=1921086 RepID=A0A2K8KZ52_MARES|nr:UDP-N-acetylglucosamine 2-epimerase (non-hydrolyzing) [Mariprofundus aestuarium]ATX80275.1 UDP-N-acetylglucosamine 2-epimerase (non-hydrolysing) [Mariprofundus aestuarium]
MIKVMTIVGTRPEIIKLSEVMKVLDRHTNHVVVHTGQNYDYELNEIFFEQLGVRRPDFFLEAMKGTASETIGDIIAKADKVIADEQPDAILLYGDTNSCLSVIPAKKRKVPIFHMEAGNRCFDQRVPEEINRKIVDHLSDINMPLSEQARDYLISEGIRPETIIKTGSSMLEVLNANMDEIQASDILQKEGLEAKKYILMSVHREENVDSEKNFSDLLESIDMMSEVYGMPIIISTHPRTRKKLEAMDYESSNELIRFSKPYGFHEYNKLQMEAFCVISDSGTIAEEGSLLNLPAITIRQAHERPEGMDEGTLIMSGLNKERIIEAIDVVTTQHNVRQRVMKVVADYDVDNVSKKVLRIILSYTDYVNRVVWKKD